MVKPLRAGLLLSRTPVITREPPAFAKTYYKYMDELERRLMYTFPAYFYFKRGTLAQRRFDELQRGPIPRHKGVYFPRGIPDVKHNRERRYKQVINLPNAAAEEGGDPVIRQVRTVTDVDKDTKSLARKLDSTLYLFVDEGGLRLPAFNVSDNETSLHEAAERGLRHLGGEGINTWTVSNTPAAVLRDGDLPEFVIRSHILHGQFAPAKVNFAWLTAEEAASAVSPKHYEEIRDLLL